VIYLKMMRKRMRDTYLLGKVFLPNTEYLSKHPLLYLTFILCSNVISIEESDNDVQSDTPKEDMPSTLKYLTRTKRCIVTCLGGDTHAKTCPRLPPLWCKEVSKRTSWVLLPKWKGQAKCASHTRPAHEALDELRRGR
jgi:hypothetical protein